jgi:hypothetical protein
MRAEQIALEAIELADANAQAAVDLETSAQYHNQRAHLRGKGRNSIDYNGSFSSDSESISVRGRNGNDDQSDDSDSDGFSILGEYVYTYI